MTKPKTLQEAAHDWAVINAAFIPIRDLPETAYMVGAKDMKERILELLRSDKAHEQDINGEGLMCPKLWADWLEKESDK